MVANTTTTDKRLDDLREDVNNRLDAMQSDIRQIRNWLFTGGITIVAALIATLVATLLNIFIGS